jgi:nucleoid-associated protein YgaU
MRTDVKIGMLIGSLLAVTAIVWVSRRPHLADSELSAGPETQRGGKPADAEKPLPGPTADKPKGSAATTKPQETLTTNKAVAEPTESVTNQHKETEGAGPERIHTVTENETLSSISQKYYGTASGWQKIYVANRELLRSPDRLRPGIRLIIPR